MIVFMGRVFLLGEFDDARDVEHKYFSDRFLKDVVIDVDDIPSIYEDDYLELEDVDAVGKLVDRFVKICKSERIGSLKFCVSARDELLRISSVLEDSTASMRSFVNPDLKERGFRKVFGSRERTRLLGFIENGLDELNEEIERRSFFEGGY